MQLFDRTKVITTKNSFIECSLDERGKLEKFLTDEGFIMGGMFDANKDFSAGQTSVGQPKGQWIHYIELFDNLGNHDKMRLRLRASMDI